MPYSLHVVPIRHDAVLDRVLEGQDTALSLRLIADEMVFPWHVPVSGATRYATNRQHRGESRLHSQVKLLVHADHDAWHLRPPDDGREDRSRSIIAGETRLRQWSRNLWWAFGNGKAVADSKQSNLQHWLCRAALHMPLPLSTTRATTSSDMANSVLCARKSCQKLKLGSRNTCGVGRCSFLTVHLHHPDTRGLKMLT